MQISEYDLFAYQLLHYLVVQQHYRIVRVQQHKDDLWRMNENHQVYPVIRISSSGNAGTFADTDYVRNVHRIILNLMHREGPMLILNTNPQSSPVHNAFLTQICITPSVLSEPQLTSVFHGIDRVVHRVADPDKESSTLMAQVEEAELKQQQDFIKKARKKSIPRCTIAIMAICTIFLVLEYLLAYLDGNMESAIVAVGGYYKMSIVAAHEYWRILSGGFVHNGVVHFVISLYALYAMGKLCEQRLGRGWYLAVFLSSVILGNAAQLIAAPNGIATGMSAGIFGVAAAFLTSQLLSHTLRHPLLRIPLYNSMAILAVLALVPSVSFIACIAGILCGILYGLWMHGRQSESGMKQHACLALVLYAASLFAYGAAVDTVAPLDRHLDEAIIRVYRHTPLNAYAEYLQEHFHQQYEKTGGI